LTEEELAGLERILEFGVIILLAYVIASYIKELLRTTNIDPTLQVLGQIAAFFLVPLIYYKLIRIRVEKEF